MCENLSLLILSAGSGPWDRLGISLWFALWTLGSVFFLVLSLIFGGDHDADHDVDHDVDHDADHDGDHDSDGGSGNMSPFSMKVMLMFSTGIGVGGFLGARYDLGWTGSWACAFIGGMVLGAIGYLFLNALYKRQANSAVNAESLIGKSCTVDITIGKGEAGRVAMTLPSGLALYPARSSTGARIPHGSLVVVTQLVGSTLIVEPFKS